MTISHFKPRRPKRPTAKVIQISDYFPRKKMREALADPTGKKAAKLLANKLAQRAKIVRLF